MKHQWRRIEYADDVVPWHCMVCDTFDTEKWDEPCTGPPRSLEDVMRSFLRNSGNDFVARYPYSAKLIYAALGLDLPKKD